MKQKMLVIVYLVVVAHVVRAAGPFDSLSWWRKEANLTQIPIPAEVFGETIQQVSEILIKRVDKASLWFGGTIAGGVSEFPLNAGQFATADYVTKYGDDLGSTFVQTLIARPGDEIVTVGDLHDDVASLVATLRRLELSGYIDDNLRIKHQNFYMIFLGDYTDRGTYGPEVWFLLLRLLIMNPDKVFLLRGNHEELEINNRYGFDSELRSRNYVPAELYKLYGLLPAALYLGAGTDDRTDFIVFNHGGIELGFDPKPLLTFAHHQPGVYYQAIEDCTSQENRRRAIHQMQAIPELASESLNDPSIIQGTTCGLTWGDFLPGNSIYYAQIRGRGMGISVPATIALLRYQYSTPENQVHAIIHGHEHNDIPAAQGSSIKWSGCNVFDEEGMWPCFQKGISIDAKQQHPLHNYPMYMLISSTVVDGNYSFALIKTAQNYGQWTIRLGAFDSGSEPMAFKEAPLLVSTAAPVAVATANVKTNPEAVSSPAAAMGTILAAVLPGPKVVAPPVPKAVKLLPVPVAIEKEIKTLSSQLAATNKNIQNLVKQRGNSIKQLVSLNKKIEQAKKNKIAATKALKNKKLTAKLKKRARAKLATANKILAQERTVKKQLAIQSALLNRAKKSAVTLTVQLSHAQAKR